MERTRFLAARSHHPLPEIQVSKTRANDEPPANNYRVAVPGTCMSCTYTVHTESARPQVCPSFSVWRAKHTAASQVFSHNDSSSSSVHFPLPPTPLPVPSDHNLYPKSSKTAHHVGREGRHRYVPVYSRINQGIGHVCRLLPPSCFVQPRDFVGTCPSLPSTQTRRLVLDSHRAMALRECSDPTRRTHTTAIQTCLADTMLQITPSTTPIP